MTAERVVVLHCDAPDCTESEWGGWSSALARWRVRRYGWRSTGRRDFCDKHAELAR